MAQQAESRRRLEDLDDEGRQVLKEAHARLRAAAAAYEQFLGRRLGHGDVPVHSLEEMKRAQDELDAAEAHLWEVRKALLWWSRPVDASPATQVTEWILEEDAQI